MAVKAAQLHESAMVALHEATQTPENWMELLRSVAPFYKYSFENALLISSQRPDAVACAITHANSGLLREQFRMK